MCIFGKRMCLIGTDIANEDNILVVRIVTIRNLKIRNNLT